MVLPSPQTQRIIVDLRHKTPISSCLGILTTEKESAGDSGGPRAMVFGVNCCDSDSTSTLGLPLRLTASRSPRCNPPPTRGRSSHFTTGVSSVSSCSGGGRPNQPAFAHPLATGGPYRSCRVCPCTSISSSPLQNSALVRGHRRRFLSPAARRRSIDRCCQLRIAPRQPTLNSLRALRHRVSANFTRAPNAVEAVSTAPSLAQRLHTLPSDPTDQLNSPP